MTDAIDPPLDDDGRIDLAALRMGSGEGRRIAVRIDLDALTLSEDRYDTALADDPARLDVSRMLGGGYAMRLRFDATISGPCMRCLQPTSAGVRVDSRELDERSGDAQLDSPYVDGDALDVTRWANDGLVLALPARVLCREDCRGLCPECGVDLNAETGHEHAPARDPRWSALGDLRFDDDGRLVDGG
ncbi:MAG: DUF177 domain-containing protein [Solirubrobacteraceae bacterium]|nr:DUF177 domain-containing protein [Solirubrobacteraceae bacterium]